MALKLLLFDDIPSNREPVIRALNQALGHKGNVQEFSAAIGDLVEGTYEKRLASDLQAAPNDHASLIVADRDLSGYKPHYNGLSEEVVRRVADMVGIPECGYARGERQDDPEYVQRGEQREACIRLSLMPNIDRFAKHVVSIAEGFALIAEKLPSAMKGAKKKSPGYLLANMLGKPEYAEKISLYLSGDQNRLDTLERIGVAKDPAEKVRRLGCLLGYWLWDSILRFPGVVVNEVAASSYLNIRTDVFSQENDIQPLFEEALYSGPFSVAKGPLWWRGMLDDMIADSGFTDGREFAANRLHRDIPQSQCCVDPSKPAGFYCVFSQKPVSLANSKGGLHWLPRGADIARVSTPKLEELGPWL